MGNPCFRIIQTHFAKDNNVGDVAAKEQVSDVLCLQDPDIFGMTSKAAGLEPAWCQSRLSDIQCSAHCEGHAVTASCCIA